MSDARPDRGPDAAPDAAPDPGSDPGTDAALLARLPGRLQPVVRAVLSSAVGRIVLRTVEDLARIEVFDRSMTVAAQFFTSVFPILIMLSLLLGRGDAQALGQVLGLPTDTTDVVAQAVGGAKSTSFGLIGVLFVIISATSLSRALNRAYAAVWRLPRPGTELRGAWRLVAVAVGMALSLLVLRQATKAVEELPAAPLWSLATTAVVVAAAGTLAPWLLLTGKVPLRALLPGGLLLGLTAAIVNPLARVFLERALQTSAARYGSIGVAFTYLSWLYVLAFLLLAAAVLGAVLVRDESRLGAWLRTRR